MARMFAGWLVDSKWVTDGVCMCVYVCVCVVQYGSGIGCCGVIFGTIPGFTPRTSVGVGMKCKGVFVT